MELTGKPIDRIDGRLKVMGEARYAAEFNQKDMAYAFPVRSTIANGTITRFDTTAAQKSGGVISIITPKTHHGYGPLTRRKFKKQADP